MLRLTTRARYGTRFMVDLALRSQEGSVLLRDVARRQDISEGYLEQILPFLRRAGLVIGRRGSGGGYRLARPAARITLGEILRALEGDLCMCDCLLDGAGCRRADTCATRRLWADVGARMGAVLEDFTLQEVAMRHGQEPAGRPVRRRKTREVAPVPRRRRAQGQ